MEEPTKKELNKTYQEVKNRPFKLFSQAEFSIWGKFGLGILLCIFYIWGIVLLINGLFFRTYGDTVFPQFAGWVFLLCMISLLIDKSLALYKSNLIKNPSYNELFLLLGAVLKAVTKYEQTKHTQESIRATILDCSPISNIGERVMSGIFAEANKRHKVYHSK